MFFLKKSKSTNVLLKEGQEKISINYQHEELKRSRKLEASSTERGRNKEWNSGREQI